MRPRRFPRLQQLEHLVATAPVKVEVLDAAFARFRATGELPRAQRIVVAVIDRARAQTAREAPIDLAVEFRHMGELIHLIEAGEPLPSCPDALRQRLYDESLDSDDLVRALARLALVALAAAGMNVTEPLDRKEFLGMPQHGTAGMHVLSCASLVKPPHEAEARCLMAQAAATGHLDAATERMRKARAGRADGSLGPPVPDTKTLIEAMKRMIGMAAEIRLFDEVAPPEQVDAAPGHRRPRGGGRATM